MDRRIGVHGGRRCLRVHERVRLGVDDSGRRQVGHFQRIFAGETKLNALERQRTVIVYKGRLQRQPLHQQQPPHQQPEVAVVDTNAAPHAPDAVPKAEQPLPIPVFAEGPTFLPNALSVKPWTPAHREVCVMVVVHVGVRHGGTFDGVDVLPLHCLHRLRHCLRHWLRHWPFPIRCSTNPMSKR